MATSVEVDDSAIQLLRKYQSDIRQNCQLVTLHFHLQSDIASTLIEWICVKLKAAAAN